LPSKTHQDAPLALVRLDWAFGLVPVRPTVCSHTRIARTHTHSGRQPVDLRLFLGLSQVGKRASSGSTPPPPSPTTRSQVRGGGVTVNLNHSLRPNGRNARVCPPLPPADSGPALGGPRPGLLKCSPRPRICPKAAPPVTRVAALPFSFATEAAGGGAHLLVSC